MLVEKFGRGGIDLDRHLAGARLRGAVADAVALLDRALAGHRPGGEKQGQPFWVLEIRQKAIVPVEQEMLNHWGMAAPSEAAVDEAYDKLRERKEEFGLARVQKPRFRNGSYALYFTDIDSNWWELEYRAPELSYDILRAKGDLFED